MPTSILDQFRLDGQTALIIGGNRGLGLEISRALAEAGATIVIAARDADRNEAARAVLTADYGGPAESHVCDVTDAAQIEAAVAATVASAGRIDILVNSAGINIRGPIDELSFEQFQQVQNVNVNGVWLTTRAVIPHMKQQHYGRIINVSSTLGLVGLANRTPYSASKGAVSLLTKTMALEFAPHGITCNAICPGPFLTPMNAPIAETEQAQRDIVGATALGRWGQMQEIQGAAIYLASDASSYVTGSLLVVDGGWTAK